MTDVDDFYALIDQMRRRCGGERRLADCDARTGWPARGVYFFFEPGETRATGEPRIVRIGTHALRGGSSTTLWGRLSQHRGNVGGSNPGGGNHRGSIFRLHVGQCLLARDGDPHGIAKTWGTKPSASKQVRELEGAYETRVSEYIGRMPMLWLPVLDDAGPTSQRAIIEHQSIALLSHARRDGADPHRPRGLDNFPPGQLFVTVDSGTSTT